jgi:hypothetical protein
MATAIRVDGVVRQAKPGKDYHYDVLVDYMVEINLTPEQIDDLLEQGRVDFGHVYDGEFVNSEYRKREYVAMHKIPEAKL